MSKEDPTAHPTARVEQGNDPFNATLVVATTGTPDVTITLTPTVLVPLASELSALLERQRELINGTTPTNTGPPPTDDDSESQDPTDDPGEPQGPTREPGEPESGRATKPTINPLILPAAMFAFALIMVVQRQLS